MPGLKTIEYSIKAGGVALNLTEASHVFICDVSQYLRVRVQLADSTPPALVERSSSRFLRSNCLYSQNFIQPAVEYQGESIRGKNTVTS